jgi:hypothetical protein
LLTLKFQNSALTQKLFGIIEEKEVVVIVISVMILVATIMVYVITTIAVLTTGYYRIAATNEMFDSKLPISFVHVFRLYQDVIALVFPLWPILS